ncbi:MAG TPA: hypothetical protein VLD85_12525 [Anaeromyxobacteraceae bacterium]|nr:hypothetical protein [Anaeromyxobacteraceae bacterium]
MDAAEVESLRGEVDALTADLELERYRHVAGIEPSPSLAPLFRARSRAAHRDSATRLRELGEPALAARVASLRAERAAAEEEERWRAADAAATARGPGGVLPLSTALARLPREPDRDLRRALARAAAEAWAPSLARREAAAEIRARARAELGLAPDWEKVLEADALLSATDDAYGDVLSWLARQEGLRPLPAGDLERADLLFLLALPGLDGLFPAGMLPIALRETLSPLGLPLGRIRVDDGDRPGRWPGAHAFGHRVCVRRQGGAADWEGLLDASGRALAAALGPPPSTRDPSLPFTLGALLSGLLLDRGFLERRTGAERKLVPEVVRLLALRRLFALRARAAALRVASEVERGTSGAAWRSAHREALGLAARAAWPEGLGARDADGPEALAALRGAARAERLVAGWRERYDEDWWRNPRAADAVAGLLAGGAADPEPPLALAGEALARRMG